MIKNETIIKEFPVLAKEGLHYLDSAATCQKPNCVIDAMTHFYKEEYATVHRGIYDLSQKSHSRNLVSLRSFLGVYSNAEQVLLSHAPSQKRALCREVLTTMKTKEA